MLLPKSKKDVKPKDRTKELTQKIKGMPVLMVPFEGREYLLIKTIIFSIHKV